MTRRVVLVGGGPANLHVLRHWGRQPMPDVELVLVSTLDPVWHGEMVPDYLRGAVEAEALRVNLPALARAAGARLVTAPADTLRIAQRVVRAGNETLEFDLCAIDLPAGVADADLPGVREHALTLRPARRAREVRERLEVLVRSGHQFDIAVVGAGRQGVEAALALHQRINAAGASGTVTVIDRAPTVLPGAPRALRDQVAALFAARGIGMVLGSAVTIVHPGALALASGAALPAGLVVWAAGPAPHPLLATTELARGDAGYLRVDRALRVVDASGVLAAGESAGLDGKRRSMGPDGARQGAALLRSLRAALGAGRPGRYRPRARTLALLDTSDGRAIAQWGGLHASGRWASWLKRSAGRRFMREVAAACDEKPGAAS